MRAGGALLAALLLFIAYFSVQISKAEDLYWEGEEDSSDEFLEVKQKGDGLGEHLQRMKRDLIDWILPFSSSSTTTTENYESNTEDRISEDDEIPGDKEDDHFGSGLPEKDRDFELREKTLRVTFVVIQPYQPEYSNRDSQEFRSFSRSLANAVNVLYDSLPGTQKASLVRIQSRISDNFSCNVTLDIVTSGYDNTDTIADMLRDHIRQRRMLGPVAVSDADFSAHVIDPGYSLPIDECDPTEIHCDDGQCVAGNARCNGTTECSDRSDEAGCPQTDWDRGIDQSTSSYDGGNEGAFETLAPAVPINWPSPDAEAEGKEQDLNNEFPTTTALYGPPVDESSTSCPSDTLQCDITRCVPLTKRCDYYRDCFDGTDEAGCPESCGQDDFRCKSGKCIEGNRRCNRVFDCEEMEDEYNCECTRDEFQCVSDGVCIEERKRCDRVNHCSDGSDEIDCESQCPSGSFTCDPSSSRRCATRCDNNPECDTGEDEEDCDECSHRCDGRCLEENLICDGRPNCSDGSDEIHCDTCDRSNDFRCKSGECLNIAQRCNGINECEDYSDELNCNATIVPTQRCAENQFQCQNGVCINSEFRCDNHADCVDGSDELNCRSITCDDDNFQCYSGECIPAIYECDGRPQCADKSDELRCPTKGPWDTERYQPPSTLRPFYTTASPDYGRNTPGYGPRPGEGSQNGPGGTGGGSEYGGGGLDSDSRSPEYGERESYPEPGGNYPQPGPSGGSYPGSGGTYPGSGRPYPGSEGNYPGSEGTYPESGGSYPGPGGRYPGSGGTYPGSGATYPGSGGTYPGSGGTYPGSGGTYPGSGGTYPGSEGAYPDSGGSYPGSGGNYPGSGGSYPGSDRGPSENGSGTQRYDQVTSGYPPLSGGAGGSIPASLKLKTYPDAQKVRNAKYASGGDVVFRCRDEGPLRAPVRWVREGGRQIKPGFVDRNGRLELNLVSVSDSGVYICQAPKYLGYPGSELRVELTVEPAVVTQRPPFLVCKPYEATCGNGQCILKSAVCDGKRDCSDGSDEDACIDNGKCEPNQFQCKNRKCVLKTWLCDSEDDCGDGSDEENCGPTDPRQLCLPVEFKCSSNDQCIPKSFHCDGQSDCADRSDEIGCAPVHVSKPPAPSNVRLNPGEVLTLTCEAVGTPVPLISWRLNWGHVPPKCTSTNDNGVGTLVCPDMQPEDSGAYSCEAINNKGTTFATPDSIVIVNRTDVCPNGYFNSEARTPNDCIPCFCFGESTQCRSADLFTYNMPTPLGEGGTRLVGVTLGYNGEVQMDSQPISDQYYYQALRNGATVTKLENYGSSWSYRTNAHPYLTLPESYNGNQLTSYGGHIKYRLAPHSPRYGADDTIPTIVIKGKYESLVHYHRGDNSRESYVETRLTPENWQKASSRGLVQATRQDIMMALDNIEMILLRADLNNAGVNITDFTMESAHHINVGMGAANLVEECTCPPGYEGLSCQKCASGYVRQKSGPWLGNCVPEQKTCPPGTYGDPSSGYACRPCPCPRTNPQNQFAKTCALGPNGDVICDCPPGYGGNTCEYCESGYVGNPLISGDYCKRQPTSSCNPVGTLRAFLHDECQCKDQVQGRYCDQCKNDSFYLSEDFSHGCALCFCSGVSQQCQSSNLRRKTIAVQFNTPQIVDQVRVYSSAPIGPEGTVKYNAPVETNLRADVVGNELTVADVDRARETIYYWSLPASFAGDKVTSYGGFLHYTLRYVSLQGGQSSWNKAADVQLISDNRLTFHYFGNFAVSSDGTINASVQFLEKGWHRSDGKDISREHFLLALADVKTILIKATYAPNTQVASLGSASIEIADANGDGPLALHVEQCVCPKGYIGSSCEDCAVGYTRGISGLYLEHCEPCNCNGHSNMCHPETGVCFECRDNTAGDSCELCEAGYVRNDYDICVPTFSSSPAPGCGCDPRGEDAPCESTGYCNCKQNVEGNYCERCRPGSFGLDGSNPLGCISCYCSGLTSECHEASHYYRIAIPAPILTDNYGGYSLTDLNAETVLNDNFIPAPRESELTYVFNFPPTTTLFWSLPNFPGNRVTSYGGTLSLRQSFNSENFEVSTPGTDVVLVGDTSIYWTNPTPIRSGETLSYQVPLKENGWFLLNTATPASRVDFMNALKNLRRVLVRATLVPNISQTSIADVSMDIVTEESGPGSQPAKGVEICMCPEGYTGTSCEECSRRYYRDESDRCRQCNCNGHDCQLDRNYGVVCNCQPPYTGADCSSLMGDSMTNVTTRPTPPKSTVVVRITSPTIKIQEVGSSVNFTCTAESQLTASRLPVTWIKEGGYLPQGRSQVDSRNGWLIITNIQSSDSGTYICQSDDRHSTGQAYAILKVPGNEMTLPSVSIEPLINDYYEGDSIQLQCVATGNPAPKITWQRTSNRPLPLSAEAYESVLYIPSAREEDSGEYRCIASNAAGATDRIAVITIRQKPSSPPRDKLTVSPTSSTVNEGQSTRLVCTGTTNVPAGSIDWIRQDGTEFLTNVRSDNGVLYIDFARPENQGIYICQSTSSGAAPVPVVVSIIPLATIPPSEASNISVTEERVKVPTGGSTTVNCNPSGYPLPLIKWRKHNAEFGPRVSQRDNTLLISNAQEEDAGYYVCEGYVDGNVFTNVYVYVEIEPRVAPYVQIWPQGEQAVALGSQFEFHCRVLEGIPEPDVMWDRTGGRSLSTYTHIQPHNVLRFERVDVNDEGEYTCSATNVAGRHSASAVLKVRSAPEITITPGGGYITPYSGDPVTIECRASGYPEPMVSIKSTPDLREMVPPSSGMAVFRIASVSERDEGDYLCLATSAAGTIEEQFAIRLARGDGGNDGGGSGEGEINPVYPPDYNPGEPSSLIAYQGRDKILECNAPEGTEVMWQRSESPLQNNAVSRGRTLVISNVSKFDAGVYECTIIDGYTNEVQGSQQIRLEVVAPPRITLQPKTQSVQPGQSPNVECVVEGDDIVDIKWRPLERPLSSRVEIRGSTLTFNQIEVEDAGKYECSARNRYNDNAFAVAEVIVSGLRDSVPSLVAIEQPRRQYRVRDDVEVLCRASSRDIKVNWERYGNNQQRQYVESRTYGDGSMLVIRGVELSDAGVYRCTGRDPYGRSTYEDFNLEVQPASNNGYVLNNQDMVYSAKLGHIVDLPCNHNLEQPVQIEWRREYTPLPDDIIANEPNLHLERVTEADAGMYVCRVSNNRAEIEARAILRVIGVVPQFRGDSWISMEELKDAFRQFEIEISFKPRDENGLLLYNSQNQGRSGKYLALQLVRGVPQFVLDVGTGPVMVNGDRPLQLNTWHTVRISRTNTRVTMDVDNSGPFITEPPGLANGILELYQPLYIGGVPDFSQLPSPLDGATGFNGCVSMLVLGREEKNIMLDSRERHEVQDCDSCSPNLCQNNGVCQEARNERGFTCLCAAGYAGLTCDRSGEACHPGLCGSGKCTNTEDGYKCTCPVTYTGRNCEVKQSIEFPAFTGSAYLALEAPKTARSLRMSMKIKPTSPVTDGIIMYCAESNRGYGGFMALIVRDGKLEFRYNLGDGSASVILTANRSLPANEWTDVHISRIGVAVSLKINYIHVFEEKLLSPRSDLHLETPMFVGGVDDSIILNNNTGVTGGFNGCIKDVTASGENVDIVNSSIQSANVQECNNNNNFDRGDIPEAELCSQCRNGGYCTSVESTACTCPPGYTGTYCESLVSQYPQRNRRPPTNPCAAEPCRNGGTCKPDRVSSMNYSCDCPLHFAGANCQMPLKLQKSVGFNGDGYLELPAQLLRYDNLQSSHALIALAFYSNSDGVLLYQREISTPVAYGDYILLRVDNGKLVLDWDSGSGLSTETANEVYVNDGERHLAYVNLNSDGSLSLEVDGHIKMGYTSGFTSSMNADSNIYIGGIPESYNLQNYPGFSGCIEEVTLTDMDGIDLGSYAVAGRNTQRCKNSRNI